MRSWLALAVTCAAFSACGDDASLSDSDAGLVDAPHDIQTAGRDAPSTRAGSAAPAAGTMALHHAGGAGGAAAVEAGSGAAIAGTSAAPEAGSHAAAGTSGQSAGTGGGGSGETVDAGVAGDSGADAEVPQDAGVDAGDTSAAGSGGAAGGEAGASGSDSGIAGSGAAGSGTDPDAGAGSGAAGQASAAGSGGTGGTGGTAGAAAGSGGAAGAPVEPAPVCSGPPGLYAGTTCTDLAAGVERFIPQYPLFTDDGQGNSATKTRWIYLPSNAVIDTSNPDRWAFPVGTILFKQFVDPKSGKRVETRRMEKTRTGSGYTSWLVQSYAWSDDQLRVSVASSQGVTNALGTGFDIPSATQCQSCHLLTGTSDVDAPIGFNAIQLNHDKGGLDLATLLLRGTLSNVADSAHPNVTLQNSSIPGSAVQKAGLGYLHGNCSHCHGGPSPHGHQLLWTPVGTDSLTDLPMFGSGATGVVCHCLDIWRGHSDGDTSYKYRIFPSTGDASGIVGRMRASAGTRDAMPPVGRKGTDNAGIQAVIKYIDSLDGSACLASPPTCSQ